MAQELTRITEAFEAYALSLGEGRYYDAHEDLEHLWHPARFEDDDEVRLWKGFINAAVSFELLKRGRPEPSKTAWATYRKYLPLLYRIESPHYPTYVKITQIIENEKGKLCLNF